LTSNPSQVNSLAHGVAYERCNATRLDALLSVGLISLSHTSQTRNLYTATKQNGTPLFKKLTFIQTVKNSLSFTIKGFDFDVRHLRCANQYKYRVEVQSKHNKNHFISKYGGTELTTTCFGLLTGHHQFVFYCKVSIQYAHGILIDDEISFIKVEILICNKLV